MRIVLLITVALSMVMAEPTMVKDPKTNLIWEDTLHSSENKVTHGEAKAYCKALKLDTFENWRLPTLPELLTIVDYTRYKPAIVKEFKHVDNDTVYWSSTISARASDDFWGVVFRDGSTKTESGLYGRYIRCVRDIR
ncbi:MAG: DUF1566 domain-containing protein [Sulfurovum sp.]|nr:DUF1566 domain-containing protein [Sulfurovum sp.]NNJ45090.1 DUF1566 domain-containing protein [Sulfurovum sp.]